MNTADKIRKLLALAGGTPNAAEREAGAQMGASR